ncbi:MFS transporter [Clostridium estertheticum]|uniref:MFS transporter n=1 Tax=Clostridium estertheticum TaxID=238834 RepID=UPI001C0D9449|nr:MFS transporter [Clostridium estertheticum]MBU3175929.1 MFS transporter [Clostridium estertheticum]
MNKKINKNILLIVSGNFISKMGTSIFYIDLLWWLVKTTGSSRYMGYVMTATILPNAIISPLSGVLSDRYNKKNILIIADIISGIAAIGLGIMTYLNYFNLGAMVVTTLFLGLSNSIFGPTIRSLIPKLVDSEYILNVNSIFSTCDGITKVVGPLMGGIMLAIPFIGVSGAFIINGLSFFISAAFELFINYKHIPCISSDSKSIRNDMRDGFLYIFQNKSLKRLLIAASLANVFLASFTILTPLFISKILNRSVNYYSFTLTMEAIGGIFVGAILLIFKKNNKASLKYMEIYIILLGVVLLFIPISTIFNPILLILAFFFGLLSVSFDNTYFTYIQTNTKPELMGRVFSVIFSIGNLGLPLSYLFFGILGDYLLASLYIISGISVVLCAFIIKTDTKSEESVLGATGIRKG